MKMDAGSLRILVVLPMYGGSLPIGEYCAKALRELGHNVRVFEAQELYAGYTGLKRLDLTPDASRSLENSFLRLVSQAVWLMAREQEPQLVLALAQAPLDKSVLQRMRQAGMRTVMWFVEDYQVFSYWRAYAPLYDAFAIIQKEPFLSELRAIGQENAFYLPLAALPQFHKPLSMGAMEKKEYGADISFLGAGYPNRRMAFRALTGRDFKIWGSDWDGETALSANIQRQGKRISPEESVKIYNASKINLNLHSNIDPEKLVGHGDFVNPRTFELAAMGAFQLVDRRSLMGELFKPDELATFDDMNGMLEAIDYFLEHPEERENYARRARERALADHTYEKRMKTLIEFMERRFGPWQFQKAASEEGFSPEVRKLLDNLTGELGLPPDADFQNVVARLRQKSGALGEAETAVLFLDEWRKQYSSR